MKEQLEAQRIVLAGMKAVHDKDSDRLKYILDGVEDLRSTAERAIDTAHLYLRLACDLERFIRDRKDDLLDVIPLLPPMGTVVECIQSNLNELAKIDEGGPDVDLWPIPRKLSFTPQV